MENAGGHRIHVGGDASGQVSIGDHNTLVNGPAETVDLAELSRFTEAVLQALPALGLHAADQVSAQSLATGIVRAAVEPEPDHRRLRAAGRTLRALVEGAAANALAAGLITLWTP